MTAPASDPAARATRRVAAARVAALFDEHSGMVFGLCRLLLRDHHEAEDAAQQTFVSAYRSMLRGSHPRDEVPWLAAIARNECRARIRMRMRAPLALDGEAEEAIPDPGDVAEQADRRAELAALTAAIAELPERQREVVALRDFLGLSYEEVADRLSVSVPVVESLLFRARRRLRDSVRTVPRYAAGVAALPFALRAALGRDGDLDGAGTAGLAGAATAVVAGGVAKLISLPFASKAATAVTVIIAAAVGPNLITEQPPETGGANAPSPTALASPAPSVAGDAAAGGPTELAAPGAEPASSTPADTGSAQSSSGTVEAAPAPQASDAAPAEGETDADAEPADEQSSVEEDPDRGLASTDATTAPTQPEAPVVIIDGFATDPAEEAPVVIIDGFAAEPPTGDPAAAGSETPPSPGNTWLSLHPGHGPEDAGSVPPALEEPAPGADEPAEPPAIPAG